HTVFLNHLGRPTVGLEFDGKYGVYHSMYDNHYWVEHFGDPGYQYHLIITRLWGTLALRLANADVLPFDFASYAAHIRRFVDDLDKNSKVQPNVDLASLYTDIDEFEKAGGELNAAAARLLSDKSLPEASRKAKLAALNRTIMDVESNWLTPDGIPGRPWFKHLLYAARYTYAHLELPGLTEAAEKGDWKVTKEQQALLESAIKKNTELLRTAKLELEKAK
ncbi:MAG: transferrin receptor-like dimerization domain-containing protein, partial [Terriglobales bacterium]